MQILVATLFAVSLATAAVGAPTERSTLAPLITPPLIPGSPPAILSLNGDSQPHIVPDAYIVTLTHPHALNRHLAAVAQLQSDDRIRHVYAIGDFAGYAATMTAEERDAVRAMADVKYVERDSLVWASETETGAPWGLARISHRKPLGFGSFNKYLYDGHGGEGVDAYVVDTGVNIDHVEFEGRAAWGKTIPQNDVDKDGNGHGTHVAGTIASAKYGVAKKANIIAVKVLGSGGSGTMSDVVAGVAWAATSALNKAKSEAAKTASKFKGSVANMSLGGGKSPALNDAVANAVKSGLHFAVAAGNENSDACNVSPASVAEAVTVGATTIADDKAYFSNHGKCVDIQAPGLNILSTWNTGNNAVNTISGTSMASPHVAGMLAYVLSLSDSDEFAPTRADYASAGVPYPSPSSSLASGDMIEIIYKIQRHGQVVVGKLVQYVSGSSSGYGFGGLLAPTPKKPAQIDPKVLKAQLIRLGTEGIIKGLPDQTVNVLLFNNYTKSS